MEKVKGYTISRLICECEKEFINIWQDDDVLLVVFERHILHDHAGQQMKPTMILTKTN